MKPMKDYSWVRGVNYGFMGDDERQKRELGYGKRVGLNATRFWLASWEWEKHGDKYLDKIVHYTRICYECGYQVMPIIFNGNMVDPTLYDEKNWERYAAFEKAIIGALKDEPGLLVWDIMNEPCCNEYIGGQMDEETRAQRKKQVDEFLVRAANYAHELDKENAITIGYTTSYEMGELTESAKLCDVLSFHDYTGTLKELDANYSNAQRIADELGKPVMQTETGCLARCNPYDLTLSMCEKYKMGWYLFELMIFGRCDSEHGIFYPDGTVRDPATIAAMMGCYRNRNLETIIVPVPNREGASERCINDIKKALTEYTCDAFDYRRSSPTQLLEACERAANLLECCDMIPMAVPPTARIYRWRQMENPNLEEIRRFAYELALKLKDISEIL